MKTKMMRMAAIWMLSAVSCVASANDGVLPGKTGDIGSATGQTASCSFTIQNLDLAAIVIHTNYKTGDMPMLAFNGDERLQAKRTLDVGGGYEVAVSVTYAPGMSTMRRGEDLLLIDVRLQRLEVNGKRTVLTSNMISSDEARVPDPKGRFLYAGLHLENPEILTVAINQKKPMSAYGLLEAGLIPNGILSDVHASCSMEVKE